MRHYLVVAVLGFLFASSSFGLTSDDAYIEVGDGRWILGTKSVERTLIFENGELINRSIKNKISGHELSFPKEGAPPDGAWQAVGAKTSKLKQGELKLELKLRRDSLEVTRTYTVYPGSSIIREGSTFTNVGATPLEINEPEFLSTAALLGDPAALDFHWMTGGANQPGAWVLKTEKLESGRPRTFDSYDPFPRSGGCVNFSPGALNSRILYKDRQVWPAPGWRNKPTVTGAVPFEVSIEVVKGDRLSFLVTHEADMGPDITAFDPTIVYADGEAHTASREFSGIQDQHGWRYQALQGGNAVNLRYDSTAKQWRSPQDIAGPLFVGAGEQHAAEQQDAVRVWTASKSGRVRISGQTCDAGTQESAGFRAGSATYAPWVALYNHDSRDGLFIGWDYFGHWTSSYTTDTKGGVTAQLHVAGHRQTLAPGQSLTLPQAFVGLYRDDLDNAGNELLDWQYQYLWDYTREGWFPAIRMLGNWAKGTPWAQPDSDGTGSRPDDASIFRKVFRVADLMRTAGADVYHRDCCWWDRLGDWNGPDFHSTNTYLRKYGMGELIYVPLYNVDPQSPAALAHPDWLLTDKRFPEIGRILDMSRPEAIDFMAGQLDSFVARWGDFEWRNDGVPTHPRNGDDTPLLGQDRGFRELLQRFLNKHPKSAFQAVNNGGTYAGYDYVRYASSIQFSDGAIGIMRNYWASLLLPPDKTNDIPDVWNPDNYDKSVWRGLLCSNFDMTGDTWESMKLEGIRELIDIYHYLQSKEVVGRWVHVFRPTVVGDDPTMYFERLSRDGQRGIIIPKRPASGRVIIKPKGLLATMKYVVSYQESSASETRSGSDLMANGISLKKMPPGELIYLNLPLHPGSTLDTEAPTAPNVVTKRRGENMGYPGVELEWKKGSDNNWISYYEVVRNGVVIDKAAKGTFYFDHSAGADLTATYEVRAVDGAGNVSNKIVAQGDVGAPARVVDDAGDGDITFNGHWKQNQVPTQVAYNGTISSANQKGATAELTFEGKRVLWFTKLGSENGTAAVSIDGGSPEIVDTYSADDIWGVAVYRKEFTAVGRHTIRIEVLGDRNVHPSERTKDTFVTVDGIRVEME